MKKITLLFLIIISQNLWSQQITTNRNPVGMEHNVLFNANTRFLVTTTGPALNMYSLFDGRMEPSYTSTAPTETNPTTILIENLPGYHTQAGAWVGWSTRYLPARRFKIEGYDTYSAANTWRTIADYSTIDFNGSDFSIQIPFGGAYTKLKFTFYTATGSNGFLGVSELFFIHPEATTPYQGLFASAANSWENNSSNLYYNGGNIGIGTSNPNYKLHISNAGVTGQLDYNLTIQKTAVADGNSSAVGMLFSTEAYGSFGKSAIIHERTGGYGIGNLYFLNNNMIDNSNPTLSDVRVTISSTGNVGIGTTTPDTKLTVNGNIHAKEVKIDLSIPAPDYVFAPTYKLKTLQEVEEYIKKNNHLPEIPSAKEFEKNGLMLAEMNMSLLQKIEEMTLYMISQSKEIEILKQENKTFKTLSERLSQIENQLK